jgi:hypothetical protein
MNKKLVQRCNTGFLSGDMVDRTYSTAVDGTSLFFFFDLDVYAKSANPEGTPKT